MNLFVIGDIHGCYHTFKELLDNHWNKETERVIQLGDLIDRGGYSPQTVDFARKINNTYPNQVIFLKGNHEFEMIDHFLHDPNHNWLRQGGEDTLAEYQKSERSIENDVSWFQRLPLLWENEDVLVTHAGISHHASNPFDEDDSSSVLWNRGKLKNINKLQIIGHTPCREPSFDEEGNAWNIDTGAAYDGYLTGIKVSPDGSVRKFVKQQTDWRDKALI
ncbi:serine/threonine protein phosphatase 1 [Scopulibacillus darangshiensis]|uniref:Serine/threonine protein phosphatase 1 n=1 Tax=Scopulibacillus darangshiensis TaxID=442528 RepID=A0A4R2P6Q9_9BACL|nr:metallophosphoesterase family protein [Scopulibacillus darangshiensis]TCP29918.1 serine/threonine protein phosphatase 1 [Scopulibacillus darangshiensis]